MTRTHFCAAGIAGVLQARPSVFQRPSNWDHRVESAHHCLQLPCALPYRIRKEKEGSKSERLWEEACRVRANQVSSLKRRISKDLKEGKVSWN